MKTTVALENGRRRKNLVESDMKATDKKLLKKILSRGDKKLLQDWSRSTRTPLRKLFSLTYDDDQMVRYQALEAIGQVAAGIAKKNHEGVRDFMRSLLWLMSEESGGVGWHAPEALAEICVNVPQLSKEFAKLLPGFIEEESFRPSTLAALYRLAPTLPGIIKDRAGEILSTTGTNHEFQLYDFSINKITRKEAWQIIELAETTAGRSTT